MTYAAALALAGAGALAAVPAHAAPPAAADFGQHVSMHARAGMLGQEHHPGMHQGKSGWHQHHEHMGTMS